MQRITEQAERMVRYLLGDLPETEQTAVEQEYFADPEKFEAIWSAENDLVDRYMRSGLSHGERELFELNYLQSPKHGGRVAVARKLLEAALSLERTMAKSVVAPQVVEPVSSWRKRLIETLNTPQTPRFIFPAASFLLLCLPRTKKTRSIATSSGSSGNSRVSFGENSLRHVFPLDTSNK